MPRRTTPGPTPGEFSATRRRLRVPLLVVLCLLLLAAGVMPATATDPGDASEDPTASPSPSEGSSEPADGTTGELLFYRRTAGLDGRGLGEYYDVGAGGDLHLVHALDQWSTDHKLIVPVEMDGTPGDELLFYRPQPTGERGWGEFYDVNQHGGMRLIRRLQSWSTDHDSIVAIDIDADGTDELVFYRPDPEGTGNGWGEIYDLSPHGGMAVIARHTHWRPDHDMIIGIDLPGR